MINSPLGLTFYHRGQQLSRTGEAVRPMSIRISALRFGHLAAASALCLALGACQMRSGPGDVTGSIGASQAQPRSEAQWRSEEAE